MITVLIIAGGVALILFGVRFLRKGLDRLFGPRLSHWMRRLADNRFKAFLSGLGISIVAPSSTTMSLLAVQTVQAGHMTARQMLAVMLGADIGMTITVALIALRIEQYAPILVLVGVVLFHFTKGSRSRGIGQVAVSMGFIFLGIDTIKRAAQGVHLNDDMMGLIRIAEHYPVAMALLAAALAILMQSSTATIGLVIALGMAGTVTLQTALAVVIGANVGVVITMLLVGWSQVESRRLAMGNLAMKLLVAIAAMAALASLTGLLEGIPGGMDRRVAITHTGFNLLVALIGLPLISPLHRMAERLVPAPTIDRPVFAPRHITREPPESVALALGQSMREIMHAAEIVRQMLNDLWRALKTNNIELARQVSQRDDQIDLLDAEVKRYLIKVAAMADEAAEGGEQMRQLRYLSELETIGDIIDKNLSEIVIKKARQGLRFSDEGMKELDEFFNMVMENLLIADTAFTTRDRALAQQLMRHKERINELEREMRDRHFQRLNTGQFESQQSSSIHLDALAYLKRINSHVSHVAYSILLST